MDPDRKEGLKLSKFVVRRGDGSSLHGGKHEHCDYYVLDLMHDKFAGPALMAYAEACKAEYPELSKDLWKLAQELPHS